MIVAIQSGVQLSWFEVAADRSLMWTLVHRCNIRELLTAGSAVGLFFAMSVIIGMAPVYAEIEQTKGFSRSPDSLAIRVLPFGDSITQGGRRDRPEYTYR